MRGLSSKAARTRVRRGTAGLSALAATTLLAGAFTGTAQAAYAGADGLIAFVRHGNIYTINPESATPGSTVRRLTRDGRDSGPRWSPDGKHIAYLDRGNLWLMAASGGHKKRITSQAPAYTDARPTWSPNGRYLAFVKTRRGARYGHLTRYDTTTGKFATFSTPYHSEAPAKRQIKVTPCPPPSPGRGPATPPASVTARSSSSRELPRRGARPVRAAWTRWASAQSDYRNGFPSAETTTAKPVRQLDPDWYPNNPLFSVNVLTSQQKCPAGHCSATGIDLTPASAPILPGAYQAVYSPSGVYLAYVRNRRGGPEIYLYSPPGIVALPARALTSGTQPDWQPVRPAPVT